MKTILIIEDNTDIRESCIEILELSGYAVLQSDNGKSGLNLALKYKPDLILCDIIMPEMDGYGVLFLLNKNEETADIPFIFLTAKTEWIDFRKGMEMGADDYLTKPFDDRELLHAVETRINKHQRQKSYHSSTFENIEKLARGEGKGIGELKELITGRKVKQLRKKQILFYEGDHPTGLYLILKGSIKTIKTTEDGRQFITGLQGPDDYIGLHALLLDEAFTETAEAVENTLLYLLPKDQILGLLNKYPEISTQFIKILSNDIHEKEEQLLELAYHSVRKRMARVLFRLNKRKTDTDQIVVSREELAALAGISVETVSRTLTDFKQEGLLEKNGNQIHIIDNERLIKI